MRSSRLDRVFTHDTLASTWLSDFTSPTTQRLVFLGAFRVAFHADDLLAVFKFSRIEVRVAAVFQRVFVSLPSLSSLSSPFCVVYHLFCCLRFGIFRISRHVFAFPICVANFVIVYIARERKVT